MECGDPATAGPLWKFALANPSRGGRGQCPRTPKSHPWL